MLSLLRSLFYILLNASCVYWFQTQEICITPFVGGEKGAHKHLCSTVGSYGINPITFMHGFLSIFSQTLLELKYVGSPTRRAV